MRRSGFFVAMLALMPACGRTGHGDGGTSPSDAGVDSARPSADSAVPSADGTGPAGEAAIPVPADGAADRAASDLLAPDVATVTPDAFPDSPVDASPEAAVPQTDSAVDGGDVNQMPPSDGGADGGPLDLATAVSGKTLTYWVTTELRRPDGGSSLVPTEQVTVTPYAKDIVVFSAEGSTLQVAAVQDGGAPVTGTRTSTDQGKWTYRLAYFAGGELVVWGSGTTIYASETQYGSGLPIIESTRGELRAN